MPRFLELSIPFCCCRMRNPADAHQYPSIVFVMRVALLRADGEKATTLPSSTASARLSSTRTQKWQHPTNVIAEPRRRELMKRWVGRRHQHFSLPAPQGRSSSCFTMRRHRAPRYQVPRYVAAPANLCALVPLSSWQLLPPASSSGPGGTSENSKLCLLRPALCSHAHEEGHFPHMECSYRTHWGHCLHPSGAAACNYRFASPAAQTSAARFYIGHTCSLLGARCRFSKSCVDPSFSYHALRRQQQHPQQPPPTGDPAKSFPHGQELQQTQRRSGQSILTSQRRVGKSISVSGREQRVTKTGVTRSASPERHFLQDALMQEGALQCTKVSAQGGPDALFSDCLDHLRQKRYDLDPDVDTQPSPAIEKLTQNERNVVLKILQRVDPERKVSPRLEARGWYIDPFWDPFKRVEDLQLQVAHDLTEFARLIGAAEARRQRLLLRASLRRHYRLHDPLNKNSRYAWGSTRTELFPTPHRVHERFWDPTVDIRVALKNNNVPISWRDLHVLHHFVGENGLILPRRTTRASRYQQQCIFKAISMARRMALFPYDWKPTPGELMPIMDPLQFLADELTARYVASGDLRAEAMLRVMLAKYPELNYSGYVRAKALRSERRREERRKREQEARNDFTTLLRFYKKGSFSTIVDP